MPHRFRHTLFLAVLLAGFFPLAAHSQEATQLDPHWPLQSEPAGILPIDLVTVSEPGVRHKCRVHSITETEITCGVGIGSKPVVYPRENVAALISPPSHAALIDTILEVTAGTACILASVFVPITAAAVIMQVAGGISFPDALFNYGVDNDDHSHDILRYQRPNTPLTVTLR